VDSLMIIELKSALMIDALVRTRTLAEARWACILRATRLAAMLVLFSGCGGPPTVGANGCPSDMVGVSLEGSRSVCVDRYEVSGAEFEDCLAAGACVAGEFSFYKVRPKWPAAVSYQQAEQYCRWRSKRLPLEREWEAAAAGPPGARYPWGDQEPDCELAHFKECPCPPIWHACYAAPANVDSKPGGASASGAVHIVGNLAEWVDTGAAGDVQVFRGGAYNLSMTTRDRLAIQQRGRVPGWEAYEIPPHTQIGFRCAK
jgi:formylglycine-generating enzyme required for sulfatase activity